MPRRELVADVGRAVRARAHFDELLPVARERRHRRVDHARLVVLHERRLAPLDDLADFARVGRDVARRDGLANQCIALLERLA